METKRDTENVLKRALEKRQTGSLPSNFTFRMMERVLPEAKKKQKRRELTMLLLLLSSVLVLVGVATCFLVFQMDSWLRADMYEWRIPQADMSMVGFYCYIAILSLLLLGMDYWIRKKRKI